MNTNELGKLIRAYRKSNNLTQADVSSLCNVGNRFLSDLERGKETAEIGLVLKVLSSVGLNIIIVPRDQVITPEYLKLKAVMDDLNK